MMFGTCWHTCVANDDNRSFTDTWSAYDKKYLKTGVEDGWIKVDKEVWREYLNVKDRIK